MEDWMRALTCAGYDYMRKAVSDLQRQLNELNAMSRLTRPDAQTANGRPGGVVSHHSSVAGAVGRVNPFNQDHEATPEVFPHAANQEDVRPSRARTFEEMHFDIGEQIRSAMTKTQKHPHIEK